MPTNGRSEQKVLQFWNSETGTDAVFRNITSGFRIFQKKTYIYASLQQAMQAVIIFDKFPFKIDTMGWDVVAIGLKHDLPVDDPPATAQAVARRMNTNIRLVYENKFIYDEKSNTVTYNMDYEVIELGMFTVNEHGDFLQMTVADYQKLLLVKQYGAHKLSKSTYRNFFGNRDTFLSELSSSSFELYEIASNDENETCIRIFKENVDIDIFVSERWSAWEHYFHNIREYKQILQDYRMQIYEKARIFGCKEVIICADQGPGGNIYDNMNLPSDNLISYIKHYEYLKGYGWITDSEADEWKNNARHILFASAIQEKPDLSDKEWVDVIFDDFADIATGRTVAP